MTYKIMEIDGITQETNLRDMTAEEVAQYEADNIKRAQRAAELEAERSSLEAKKQEVLAKLGLTPDEVTALLA